MAATATATTTESKKKNNILCFHHTAKLEKTNAFRDNIMQLFVVYNDDALLFDSLCVL